MQYIVNQFFNPSDLLINPLVKEILDVVESLPLFLKTSKQTGKAGNMIFDPSGTNTYIRDELKEKEWKKDLPIPTEYQYLGLHIDYFKKNVAVEVQFSNYPFLSNNILRLNILYDSRVVLGGKGKQTTSSSNVSKNDDETAGILKIGIIVTKAHKFPASNSTLYFEQAMGLIEAVSKQNYFSLPIVLIGLDAPIDESLNAQLTEDSKMWTRTGTYKTKEVILRIPREGARGIFEEVT